MSFPISSIHLVLLSPTLLLPSFPTILLFGTVLHANIYREGIHFLRICSPKSSLVPLYISKCSTLVSVTRFTLFPKKPKFLSEVPFYLLKFRRSAPRSCICDYPLTIYIYVRKHNKLLNHIYFHMIDSPLRFVFLLPFSWSILLVFLRIYRSFCLKFFSTMSTYTYYIYTSMSCNIKLITEKLICIFCLVTSWLLCGMAFLCMKEKKRLDVLTDVGWSFSRKVYELS